MNPIRHAAHRTGSQDLALVGFVLTACVAYWAAYDRATAVVKLLAIVTAAAIYYVLARTSGPNLWKAAKLCGKACAALAGITLLTSILDGQAGAPLAARFGVLVRILPLPDLDTEIGLVVVLLPFQVAATVYTWRRGDLVGRLSWLGACLLVMAVLLATDSRGAVVAIILSAGAVFWVAHTATARQPRGLPVLSVTFAGLLALGAALAMSGGMANAWAALMDRARLAEEGLWLAQDFLITGGGLGSFPGLYSRYILLQPFLYFTRSYNLFLDLVIEQGLPALATYLAIIVGAVWSLAGSRELSNAKSWRIRLIRSAAIASLLAVILLGLVHDPFHEPLGALFLFVGPGFAVALHRSPEGSPPDLSPGPTTDPVQRGPGRLASPSTVGLLVFALVMLTGAWPLSHLPASLWANVGAVRMAQEELDGWPGNGVLEPSPEADVAFAQWWLEAALALDPTQRGANYRMGLLAMKRQDFTEADRYLQTAWEGGQGHRGVGKALGYNLVWLGQLDRAGEFLEPIPEAAQELILYAKWWRARGRNDLAAWSEAMSSLLDRAR